MPLSSLGHLRERPLPEGVPIGYYRYAESFSVDNLRIGSGRSTGEPVQRIAPAEEGDVVRIPELQRTRSNRVPKERKVRHERCDKAFVDQL